MKELILLTLLILSLIAPSEEPKKAVDLCAPSTFQLECLMK